MSTFWDAVGRAALGLPGTAAPRPRSLYEPDGPLAVFEAVEPLEESIAGADTLTPPAVISPGSSAVTSVPPLSPDERVRQTPSVGTSDDDEEGEERQKPIERRNPAAGASGAPPSAAPPGEPAEVPPPEPAAAERIEVRHQETTRVVSERIHEIERREMPAAVVLAMPAAQVDRADPGAEQPVAADEEKHESAQAISLVAEPRTAATEPSPLAPATQDVQPLIVEIDRIEIRIEPERVAAPSPPRRTEPTAVPSLSDYLAGRDRGRP